MPNQSEPSILFRVLQTERELREHFELRHDVYLQVGYRSVPNRDHMDIDTYDLRSVHLGAFELGDRGTRQIGGVRMIVQQARTLASSMVETLLDGCDSTELRSVSRRTEGLPSARAFDFSSVFDRYQVRPEEVVEFSRTFCVPGVRRRGLGVCLTQGILTLGQLFGAPHGIGSCETTVAPFYDSSGVLVHSDLGEFSYPGIDRSSTALSVPLSPLPPRCIPTSRAIIEQYRTYGTWCTCVTSEQPSLEPCLCMVRYSTASEQPTLVPHGEERKPV